MQTIAKTIVSLFFFFLIHSQLLSAEPSCGTCIPVFPASPSLFPLKGELAILEDPEKTLKIETIRGPNIQREFQTLTKGMTSLGYAFSTYWLRVRITSSEALNGHYYIHFKNNSMDYLDYYAPGQESPIKTGDMRPFSTRPINANSFYFPLIQAAGVHDHFIRMETVGGSMRFPVALERADYSIKQESEESLIAGIILGILGILALYNLLVHVSFNDRAYLYYFFFTGAISIYLICLNGYGFRFFWPDAPSLNYTIMNFGSGIAMISAVLFTRSFLQANRLTPILYRVGDVIIYISLIHMVINMIVFSTPGLPGILIPSAIIVYSLLLVIRIIQLGFRPAAFFFFSISGFSLGITPLLLELVGFSVSPSISENGLHIGIVTMSLLLSMALSNRIRVIQNQEEQARRAVHSMQNELSAARRIQNELLQDPEDLNASLKGIHIQAHCNPAMDVAGDLYLMESLTDHSVSICVADVVGHGISAALVSSLIKSSYHLQAKTLNRPDLTLTGMNQFLCTHLKKSFATAQVIFLDIKKRTLLISSGGHPPLIRVTGNTLEKLRPEGRPLGVDSTWKPSLIKVEIQKGDRLILYTDGITEAISPEGMDFEENFYNAIFRTARLPAREAIQEINREVMDFTKHPLPDDDITLVIVDILS